MFTGSYIQSFIKIGSVTAEIFLIWSNVTRTNRNLIVVICSRCYQEATFKISSKSGQYQCRKVENKSYEQNLCTKLCTKVVNKRCEQKLKATVVAKKLWKKMWATEQKLWAKVLNKSCEQKLWTSKQKLWTKKLRTKLWAKVSNPSQQPPASLRQAPTGLLHNK